MKKVATIILNRNLPKVTEALVESLQKNSGECTDIFVVEAGSDKAKLSKYCTWWANSEEEMLHGLRSSRGFNYSLHQLWQNGQFDEYDYFFLLTNDTEFEDKQVVQTLVNELESHPQVGILSPCSKRWGEKDLLQKDDIKYFWYVHNVAYMLRKEFILSVIDQKTPDVLSFLYDGTNFRGYCADLELIAKGYANDWATAITTKVWAEENEEHLKTKSDLIKTEPFEENLRLYVEEGKQWMKRKYGFDSRWNMQLYAKFLYDKFFEYYPELKKYEI